MNILKKVSIIIVALVAGLFAVGLVLPKTAHVERSIVIEAPPVMVFTVLNGFRQFSRWSPWADIDPNATTTLEGPEAGVGSKMSWSGNAEVGTGSPGDDGHAEQCGQRQRMARAWIHAAAHFSAALVMASVKSSNSLLARCT